MKATFRPLVKVMGLSKSYGRRRVLNQLEFELMPGSGLVVKGSNGSGKTTLLGILSTISRFDEGLIEDIICKDGHVQISIFANQENFKIFKFR